MVVDEGDVAEGVVCNAGLMEVIVLLEAAVKLFALLRLNQTDNDTVKKAGFGGYFCHGHDFGIMGRARNFAQSKD
ncbi:MAG: hypothetical protein EXS25_09435 [Pedosphaera sp.]|nr:hypothetical protein [Pedosphaera sp.]